MKNFQTVEIPIQGMDCAECTRHVQQAIASLPGVQAVDVFLAAEKAVVQLDPSRVDRLAIRQAVQKAGYQVPEELENRKISSTNKRLNTLFGFVFIFVIFVVVFGEWLGYFDRLNEFIPLPLGAVAVIVAGLPVFRSVLAATWRRQITSHTLMTLASWRLSSWANGWLRLSWLLLCMWERS